MAEQDIRPTSFDSDQTAIEIAAEQYPAISIALIADGSADSLIGMMQLVDNVPTGLVQNLEFNRDQVREDRWIMILGLLVIYE